MSKETERQKFLRELAILANAQAVLQARGHASTAKQLEAAIGFLLRSAADTFEGSSA